MGWTEQLASGRYRGVARNRLTGKRTSKSFDRWVQADAWWRATERDWDGVYTAAGVEVVRQGRRARFADYVTAHAATVAGELATRRKAASHARALAARWPTDHVDEITRPQVRVYLAELRDAGYSVATQQDRLGLLRGVMAAAVCDRLRDDDPTVGLRVSTGTRQRHHRILTADELDRVTAQLPPWLRAAALLSHDAGLRIGEVAGLRWFRLDLLHASVEVADVILGDGRLREYPKGHQVLTVPLTRRVVAALTEHERHHPAGRLGHVFHDPMLGRCPCSATCRATRPRLTTERIRDHWRRARTAAGLDDPLPRWHDLRHGCATMLARAGASPYVIQEVLRHTDLSTSQRYIDRSGRASQAAARAGRRLRHRAHPEPPFRAVDRISSQNRARCAQFAARNRNSYRPALGVLPPVFACGSLSRMSDFSGRRLRALRILRGLSRTELAAMIDRTPDTVRHWEAGRARPRGHTVLLLAVLLNTSPERLRGDTTPPEESARSA